MSIIFKIIKKIQPVLVSFRVWTKWLFNSWCIKTTKTEFKNAVKKQAYVKNT